MAYDRDFDHQQELFNDDDYREAMAELVADETGFIDAIAEYQANGRTGLAKGIMLLKINELLDKASAGAESRMEMIREEKRGDCA